ncbi:MAG: hypothetical protein H7Z11_18555 [Verrucomicrobia bacterium]|nr:hypothetical protein [Leptolyngbya sp. ES-bin-22]
MPISRISTECCKTLLATKEFGHTFNEDKLHQIQSEACNGITLSQQGIQQQLAAVLTHLPVSTRGFTLAGIAR